MEQTNEGRTRQAKRNTWLKCNGSSERRRRSRTHPGERRAHSTHTTIARGASEKRGELLGTRARTDEGRGPRQREQTQEGARVRPNPVRQGPTRPRGRQTGRARWDCKTSEKNRGGEGGHPRTRSAHQRKYTMKAGNTTYSFVKKTSAPTTTTRSKSASSKALRRRTERTKG